MLAVAERRSREVVGSISEIEYLDGANGMSMLPFIEKLGWMDVGVEAFQGEIRKDILDLVKHYSVREQVLQD